MIELVSVHIPKTGGMTLLEVLKATYGLRLRLDYPIPEKPLRVRYRRQLAEMVRRMGPSPKCVHGHFPASRYADRGAPLVTFVRQPSEQRASAYHYIRREHARRGLVFNADWRLAIDNDLATYLATPCPGIVSRFVDVPVSRFSFVGSMDSYDDDLIALCDRFDLHHVAGKQNAAPSPTLLTPEQVAAFENANPQEMDLYRALIERREAIYRDG